ncbi:hypothetical protein ATANTOWER_003712 [Ataeniobius toweri]|uniref:Uncharacterized protein n=1 Tax=Ataeniobius toweri TaxID=208326 RepID=A0ABU7BJ33_9TELE|nr:hypothetical protein [Ataeniobius toweri]
MGISASTKRHCNCILNINQTIVQTVSSVICRVPLQLLVLCLRPCFCELLVYHLTCGRNSKNLAEPVAPGSFEDTALVLARLPTSDTEALSGGLAPAGAACVMLPLMKLQY